MSGDNARHRRNSCEVFWGALSRRQLRQLRPGRVAGEPAQAVLPLPKPRFELGELLFFVASQH